MVRYWNHDGEETLDEREWPDESDQDASDAEVDAELQPCPFCGESIFEDADLCPWCDNFVAMTSSQSANHRGGKWLVIGLLLAMMAMLVCKLA